MTSASSLAQPRDPSMPSRRPRAGIADGMRFGLERERRRRCIVKRVGDVMTRRVITVHEGLPSRTWPGSSGWAAPEGRHFPPERSASLDPAQQGARSRGEGSDDIPGGHGGPRGCPRDGGAHHARERCEASPRDGRPRRSGGDRRSLRSADPFSGPTMRSATRSSVRSPNHGRRPRRDGSASSLKRGWRSSMGASQARVRSRGS